MTGLFQLDKGNNGSISHLEMVTGMKELGCTNLTEADWKLIFREVYLSSEGKTTDDGRVEEEVGWWWWWGGGHAASLARLNHPPTPATPFSKPNPALPWTPLSYAAVPE